MQQYRGLATYCGIFVIVCFGVYHGLLFAAELRENVAAREQAINSEIRRLSSDPQAYLQLWDKLLKEHGNEQAALRHLRVWAEAQVDWKAADNAWRNGLGIRPESPPRLVNFTVVEFFEDFDANEAVSEN